MRYAIDTFSVFQGVVVIRGYAECGPPSLYHGGTELAVQYLPQDRPEIVEMFGTAAAAWGFRLCALVPGGQIRHGDLALRFANGLLLVEGDIAPFTSQDMEYQVLLDTFRTETEKGGTLLEIGSRARSGNVYRSRFSSKVDYIGLDVAPGPNVDVVADAHDMARHLPGEIDFVFSISVFEHLLMPWKVALELGKVMKVGGMGLIQSHAAFPLHEQPWDFWRYSRESWHGLFNSHTGFEVIGTAYSGLVWTVPAFATGGAAQDMDRHGNYLLSACLVRKTAEPQVVWSADTAAVFNMAYDHA